MKCTASIGLHVDRLPKFLVLLFFKRSILCVLSIFITIVVLPGVESDNEVESDTDEGNCHICQCRPHERVR